MASGGDRLEYGGEHDGKNGCEGLSISRLKGFGNRLTDRLTLLIIESLSRMKTDLHKETRRFFRKRVKFLCKRRPYK